MTSEQYVKNKWISVHVNHGLVDQDEYGYWCNIIPNRWFNTDVEAWDAAKEYTNKLLTEIYELRKDMYMVKKRLDDSTRDRLLAFLNNQLAAISQGMKNVNN